MAPTGLKGHQCSSAQPHVLPASAYFSPAHYVREKQLLERTWHLAGTIDELSRPGDFLTTELLGRPIQVRNFNGELRALSNVCAHRHSLHARHALPISRVGIRPHGRNPQNPGTRELRTHACGAAVSA